MVHRISLRWVSFALTFCLMLGALSLSAHAHTAQSLQPASDSAENPTQANTGSDLISVDIMPDSQIVGIENGSEIGLTSTTTTSQNYFMFLRSDGSALSVSQPYYAFATTRYADGNANSHLYQKWTFTGNYTDGYMISPLSTPLFLTVNPTTKQVTLAGDLEQHEPYQTWKQSGNTWYLDSTDASVDGYSLWFTLSHYDGSVALYASNTSATEFAVYGESIYVPPTAITLNNLSVPKGETKQLTFTKTPSNAYLLIPCAIGRSLPLTYPLTVPV